MVDFWPSEEREIVPGLSIGFAYCEAAVAEGAPVKVGATTTAGRVQVTTAAAVGDSFAVAMKYGAAYAYIPVAYSGVIKMTVCNETNIACGQLVLNSAEAGVGLANADIIIHNSFYPWMGGASHVLGLALQAATNQGDEILVLIGHCC